jgi:hypothetical protein
MLARRPRVTALFGHYLPAGHSPQPVKSCAMPLYKFTIRDETCHWDFDGAALPDDNAAVALGARIIRELKQGETGLEDLALEVSENDRTLLSIPFDRVD